MIVFSFVFKMGSVGLCEISSSVNIFTFGRVTCSPFRIYVIRPFGSFISVFIAIQRRICKGVRNRRQNGDDRAALDDDVEEIAFVVLQKVFPSAADGRWTKRE